MMSRTQQNPQNSRWKSKLRDLVGLVIHGIQEEIDKGPHPWPSSKTKYIYQTETKHRDDALKKLLQLFRDEFEKLSKIDPHSIYNTLKMTKDDEFDKGWSVVNSINLGLYDLYLEFRKESNGPPLKRKGKSVIQIDDVDNSEKYRYLYPTNLPSLPKSMRKTKRIAGIESIYFFHKLWHDGIKQLDQYCCGNSLFSKDKIINCYANPDHLILPGDTIAVVQLMDNNKFCIKCAKTVKYVAKTMKDGSVAEITPIRETGNVPDQTSSEVTILGNQSYTSSSNRYQIPISIVSCKTCERKFHTTCVHYYPECWEDKEFICTKCKGPESKIALKYPLSKYLRHTKMSLLIERRVRKLLSTRDSNNNMVNAVYVREMARKTGVTEMGPNYSTFLRNNGLGDEVKEFPYTKRTIFAFQDNSKGMPYLFFAMYCYEYDPVTCPYPNRGVANIAYLDSVPFLNPSTHRRQVHQEIIVGYIDFVRSIGFEKIWIWVCPPKQGEDFILNSHPSYQNYLPSTKLMNWYEDTLEKGKNDNIIKSYESLAAYIGRVPNIKTVDLPYLESDRLSIFYEDQIKAKFHKKPTNKKLKLSKEIKSSDPPYEEFVKWTKSHLRTKEECSVLVATLKNNNGEPNGVNKSPDMLPNFSQPFENRERFLEWAKNNNFEFSSIDHSVYSTMGIMDHMFNGRITNRIRKIPRRLSPTISTPKLDLLQIPGLSPYSNEAQIQWYFKVMDHIFIDDISLGDECPKTSCPSTCQHLLRRFKDALELESSQLNCKSNFYLSLLSEYNKRELAGEKSRKSIYNILSQLCGIDSASDEE